MAYASNNDWDFLFDDDTEVGGNNDWDFLFDDDEPELDLAQTPINDLRPEPMEETPVEEGEYKPIRAIQDPTPARELPDGKYGVLGDIGSAAISGLYRWAEMPYRAIRAFDPPGGTDIVRNWATKNIDNIEYGRKLDKELIEPSKDTVKSPVRKAIYGGIESFFPSLFTAATGGAAATAGVPIALASGLGSLGLFGASTFDQYIEDAQEKGKTYEESVPYATAAGMVEGGGEMLGNIIGMKLLGLSGGATNPFKTTVKDMLTKRLGGMLGGIAKSMPVEVGTEFLQESGGQFIRNLQGLDDSNPLKAGTEAIGPAIVMTLLFGGGGAYFNRQERKALEAALVDENTPDETRVSAAKQISNELKKKDEALAGQWDAMASEHIEKNLPIPIEESTSEYIANYGEKDVDTAQPPTPTEELIQRIKDQHPSNKKARYGAVSDPKWLAEYPQSVIDKAKGSLAYSPNTEKIEKDQTELLEKINARNPPDVIKEANAKVERELNEINNTPQSKGQVPEEVIEDFNLDATLEQIEDGATVDIEITDQDGHITTEQVDAKTALKDVADRHEIFNKILNCISG